MKMIVVGAGLFGSIIATLAERCGHEVTVLDSREPYAASKASGCVLKPSWLSSLSKEEISAGYGVLDELYGIQNISFLTHLGVRVPAHHVDPKKILNVKVTKSRVAEVGDGFVVLEDGQKLRGLVVVAAGIWSQKLVPTPRIKGLYGASLKFKNQQIKEPRIHVYAPYRQAVAFNMKDGAWMGDGTALIETSWSDARIELTRKRASDIFKLKGDSMATVGARPYVEGHSTGYLKQISPRTWVATGGAKNGTILAALFAQRLMEAYRK